ncbi:MAG: hypothetical protein QNJ42_10445 [Crocosphaera sp.]|nr:hypothetical protein [Crocosphaera sp.]
MNPLAARLLFSVSNYEIISTWNISIIFLGFHSLTQPIGDHDPQIIDPQNSIFVKSSLLKLKNA